MWWRQLLMCFLLLCISRHDNICMGFIQVEENYSCERGQRSERMGFESTELLDFEPPCFEFANENCAKKFLCEYDRVMSNNHNLKQKYHFQFLIDINEENEKLENDFSNEMAPIDKKIEDFARHFIGFPFSSSVKRMIKLITKTIASKNESKYERLEELSSELESIYANGQACPTNSPCLDKGEQSVETVMREERDYDKLLDVWKSWSDATGPFIIKPYLEYIDAANEGARENGVKDAGYFEWFSDIEDNNFDSHVWNWYEEIKPLFQELHAYVRYQLHQKYPNQFDINGPIPAHILGNPWAQQWNRIKDLVLPFPKFDSMKVDEEISKLKVNDLVTLAEDFFQSLGLPPMNEEFWKYSVFEKSDDTVMDCHASAHDFDNGRDFRIKMCTNLDQQHLTTIHHEMGHVQYYMQYAHWLKPFRESPNSGFHEAVGDTIALSVNTPEHLKKINLISDIPKSKEYDINYLMDVALSKVAFLPFGLITDVWRWRVFNGTYTKETFNEGWWDLRMKYNGIMPPVKRNKGDFDALAKYHVVTNTPYIRYFLSHLLQFQFYEAMCDASGHQGPLHRCDFYGSRVAGNLLKEMLKMGGSKPWQEAIKTMTGDSKISTKSILRFFQPLYVWLKEENHRLNYPVGWTIPNDIVEKA